MQKTKRLGLFLSRLLVAVLAMVMVVSPVSAISCFVTPLSTTVSQSNAHAGEPTKNSQVMVSVVRRYGTAGSAVVGRMENGLSVIFHPDSGCQILGMQIPRWDELRALGLELAAVLPEQKYISWDFALTDDGWVVVEGNCAGQFVCPQLTTLQGLRARLRPYFGV